MEPMEPMTTESLHEAQRDVRVAAFDKTRAAQCRRQPGRRARTLTHVASALLIATMVTLPAAAFATLRVAATTGNLAAMATAVGGEHVRVDPLSAPSEDPHFVDPRPDKLVTLSRADVLVLNGLDLETGWLPPLLVNARNQKIQPGRAGYFDASEHVPGILVSSGPIDRSQGDVHPHGSPHYSMDPRRMATVGVAFGEKLAAVDPANAEQYRANAAAFADSARALASEAEERFRALDASRRKIVVYHASFAYLTDRLGVDVVATIEPRPGIEPNPRHIAHVLNLIRREDVRAVVQERYYPRNVANTLAELTDARLVVIDAQADVRAGQSYADHIRGVFDALFNVLAGRVQ